ncbi:hypothetical protein [Lactobacillus bombicola]|uniref:Uncharacterized protein n=1 Tax=Lactobacillus bombicola TaxID=1505723 RepID=A0A396STX5_9LACO|nr:hypothetical protein [Lactobacillus bombicola]RHW55067.1 hypothetical protein DS835_01450 [Lactobacillus bombicola]
MSKVMTSNQDRFITVLGIDDFKTGNVENLTDFEKVDFDDLYLSHEPTVEEIDDMGTWDELIVIANGFDVSPEKIIKLIKEGKLYMASNIALDESIEDSLPEGYSIINDGSDTTEEVNGISVNPKIYLTKEKYL